MGETPDEVCRNIAETRERMTETVRAIKARANNRRHAVDRLLDRLPTEASVGDQEAEAAAATDASHEIERPGRGPDRSTKRNASLIVVLACAAAGAFAGLATSPDSRGGA